MINDWSEFHVGYYRDEGGAICFGVWHRPCVPTRGVWLLPQEGGWIFQSWSTSTVAELMTAVENHVCPEGDVPEGSGAVPGHATVREIIKRIRLKYGSEAISQSYKYIGDFIWDVWDGFPSFSEEKRQVWTEAVQRALLDGDY